MVALAAALAGGVTSAHGQEGQLNATPQRPTPVRSPEEVIYAQLDAFNAGDVEGLVANISEEFVYFLVDSDYSEPQLRGRAAFRDSMRSYFQNVQGPRAEIEALFVTGEFVAARERSYWVEGGREVSQASLAVYEVRDGLIHRVWYYPAVP